MEETDVNITYIVIEEHTLGYTIPGSSYAGVLHASPLRGSLHTTLIGSLEPVYLPGKKYRPATLQDFHDYNVRPEGHWPDLSTKYQQEKS